MRNMDFLQKVPVSFSGPNKPPPPSTARHFSDSFTRSWCRHCPPARPSRSPGPGKHGGPHGYGLALSGFQLFRFSSSPFPSVWLGLSYGSGPRSPSSSFFFSLFFPSPPTQVSGFSFQLSGLLPPPQVWLGPLLRLRFQVCLGTLTPPLHPSSAPSGLR